MPEKLDNGALFKSLCELYEFNLRALENAVKLNDLKEGDRRYEKIGKLLTLVKELHLLKSFCAKYPAQTYSILDHLISMKRGSHD